MIKQLQQLKHLFSFKKHDHIHFEVIVKVGEIENDNTDVMINWSYLDIKNGPSPHFQNILLKGGSQTQSSYYIYDNGHLKYCDTFTVISGMLNCELLINSIIPNVPQMYNTNFFYLSKCLKTYKEQLGNNCRFISLTIPDYQNIDVFLQNLFLNMKTLNFLKEIRFFCLSERELDILNKKIKMYL